MKRPSDKERLDYLLRRVIPYADGALMFDPLAWAGVEDSVIQDRRNTIDEALELAAALRRSKPSAKGAGRG